MIVKRNEIFISEPIYKDIHVNRKNLEYISWGFHHLFNESIGEVNTINIIDTYKMLIALASGEMYTANKIKFNNDSASKNKRNLRIFKQRFKII